MIFLFKKQALKNKELRKAYDALAPEFAIAEKVIEKRLEQGITQAELAKKIAGKASSMNPLVDEFYQMKFAIYVTYVCLKNVEAIKYCGCPVLFGVS